MNGSGGVLFVHGAGGGPWEWESWLPVFKRGGWRCRAIDLQGDARAVGKLRFGDYLERVRGAAAALHEDGPVVLTGASLGGLLVLAVTAEVHAAGLCLVNPVPPAGLTGGIASEGRALPEVVRWSRDASRAGTRRSMPDATETTVTRAMARWRDESGAVLERVRAGVPCAAPVCPTLILYGTPDREVSPAAVSALREHCRADLLMAEGAGHVGVLLGRRATLWACMAEAWARNSVAGTG